MAKVTMPQLGESVAEGTIGKWLKKPGDHVAKYEPLLEVITDKVNAEVPSPVEGILREILVEEGQTVPNNAEIAVIETAEGEAEAAVGEPEAAGGGAGVGPAGADERAPHEMPEQAAAAAPAAVSAPPASVEPTAASGDPNARMTPAVRRLLREHDLS
ncbi:MAG: biotin/lipoyl-containing protein, partial [Candidatus Limnocylindrales bacterium]